MSGIVRGICVSEQKGTAKRSVDAAELVAEFGVAGDAHGGRWHRQVSMLDHGDFGRVRERLAELRFGAFAENLIVEGVDCGALGLGSQLRLGAKAVIRISQIGKVCHTPCSIFETMGDCIMPRLGLFGRVLEGGMLAVGDAVEVTVLVARERFQAVILTAGGGDESAGVGGVLEDGLGAHIYAREAGLGEQEAMAARVRHYCDGHSIDLVVTVGDGGAAAAAGRSVAEKLPRRLDEVMGTGCESGRAIVSDVVTGVCGRTLIINVAGSARAARERVEAVLPALERGLGELRGG